MVVGAKDFTACRQGICSERTCMVTMVVAITRHGSSAPSGSNTKTYRQCETSSCLFDATTNFVEIGSLRRYRRCSQPSITAHPKSKCTPHPPDAAVQSAYGLALMNRDRYILDFCRLGGMCIACATDTHIISLRIEDVLNSRRFRQIITITLKPSLSVFTPQWHAVNHIRFMRPRIQNQSLHMPVAAVSQR
jgi:hypothetical protein